MVEQIPGNTEGSEIAAASAFTVSAAAGRTYREDGLGQRTSLVADNPA